MNFLLAKPFFLAVLLFGCSTLSIEDTEIRVSDFVDRVSKEVQVYYFLNDTQTEESVGLCLSSLEISVLATLSGSSASSVGLTLGALDASNLGLTLGSSQNSSQTRNYSFKLAPNYSSALASKNKIAISKTMENDNFELAYALLNLKLALGKAQNTYSRPVYGPPLAPTSIVAKFQFNVVKKSNSKIVLTVISSGLLGKSVLSADDVDTQTNDATATVKFERLAPDGVCRNAPTVTTPGQVVTPAPDPIVIFEPLTITPPLATKQLKLFAY